MTSPGKVPWRETKNAKVRQHGQRPKPNAPIYCEINASIGGQTDVAREKHEYTTGERIGSAKRLSQLARKRPEKSAKSILRAVRKITKFKNRGSEPQDPDYKLFLSLLSVKFKISLKNQYYRSTKELIFDFYRRRLQNIEGES